VSAAASLVGFLRTRVGQAVAVGLAIVAVVVSIAATAVNAPFADQWEIVLLLEQWQKGTLDAELFWRQHNEHRIIIPKALHFALALATGYDVRMELLLSLAVALAGFVVLVGLVRRSLARVDAAVPWWLVPLVALLYFSLVQWQNWLWGWQIEWFIANSAALTVVYLLTGTRSDRAPASNVAAILGSILVALAGTFSFGGAIHVWPIGLLVILMQPATRRYWPLWSAAGVGAALLYAAGLVLPEGTGPVEGFLARPFAAVAFALAVLGRPLVWGSSPASLVAATILGAALVSFFVVHALRARRAHLPTGAWLPWIALGIYALLNAGSSGAGRAAHGAAHALASRYATVAMLLVVATLMLGTLVELARADRGLPRAATRAVMGLLVIGTLAGWSWGAGKSMQHGWRLARISECLYWIGRGEGDDCKGSLYPDRAALEPRIEALRRMNWRGFTAAIDDN
jgi:hypothetical protein